MSPRISVIMGVYNVAPYIEEACQSILCQTYSDFEFLITDDASTDGTLRKLKKIAASDSRVIINQNEKNIGLAKTLNNLIDCARGEFIARMDGDDISMPDRFERQIKILESGEIKVCGGWITVFGKTKEALVRYPIEDQEIKAALLFFSAIPHPTVMMSTELIQEYRYTEDAGIVEDYDLWTRLANKVAMYNIPKILLRHRQHDQQVSRAYRLKQYELASQVGVHYLNTLGVFASTDEMSVHAKIQSPVPPETRSEIMATEQWLLKLTDHLQKSPRQARTVAEQWYKYCLKSVSLGSWVAWKFVHSPLYALGQFPKWKAVVVVFLAVLKVRHASKFYGWLVARSPQARLK